MGVAVAFLILAFYTAVAGWTLEYFYQALSWNLMGKSDNDLTGMFDQSLKGSCRPYLWFMIFMGLTSLIIISGVHIRREMLILSL
jgi:neurotransmitter:Na+ symporter, NSS family